MGIFNEQTASTSTSSSTRGLPGPPGPKGDGINLDADGNYDMQNKKITNVRNGDEEKDVMVKTQIEIYVNNKTQYLDGVQPAKVTNSKAVIYSSNGSIHSNALHLKDQNDKEVNFYTENQDTNQIRLYIPNLKNNDSFNNRKKSSIVVTTIDQTIEGKKIFSNIEVPQPTRDNQACNKKYVDDEISKIPSGSQSSDNSNFVKKTGDTMTGSLVVPNDNYPVQGDLNKVISYETQREILLSKKEGGKMEASIDMNNNTIFNVKDPGQADQATNKKYVDDELVKKLDKGVDIDMKNNSIVNLDLPTNPRDATCVEFVNKNFLKLDGTNSMTSDLNLNNNKIINLQTDYKDSKSAVNVDFM